MSRTVSLITIGLCMVGVLGCTELRDLRKQNAVLKSRLQQCEVGRDDLLAKLGVLGQEGANLSEKLANAKEKERSLLTLLGKLQQEQEERERKLAELREMVKDIAGMNVVSRPEGSFIVLENKILFAEGEVELTAPAKNTLDSTVVAYLKKNPEQQIRIDGHTDGQPIKVSPWKDNYHLAVMRAHSVMRYLVSRGVSNERMYIAGFGMNRPLVKPRRPTAPMSQNRRVEILLVPKAGQGIEGLIEEFGK